ncbi:hypothetical protein A0H81_00707 [Grifola frondosa]|uniref:Uncharacterized protein n=1 Tax=Grifola frondosa TaxID=5627 RepID=A0A1C7MSW9_GRIFR|nr:hypothetical protein A0H81_00707 [Grifola frondosa]
MAQLSTPPLLRHSIPPSPTSSVNPNNSQFTPRKEFIREQRVISTFSLLTLSGTGAVRLYSFPAAVISALRRLFDHQNLIVSVREHASNNFFEFSLDRRPWANIKKLESEKLIVGIVSLILQHGYSFLSTIDYGREHDDCIAIAFSKPLSVPPSSSAIPLPNGSITSLPQPSRTLFAISFPSNTVLHIIDPPLHSTPAILQAVRNAWPRGVADEKKLGDSYIFKMKGYKWFQENTFATDSLRQILSLLSALDRHAFKLLTSLCLTKRSRLKDLWIFTGPTDDFPSNESAPSTPGNLSLELNREITPQSYSANVYVQLVRIFDS